MNDHPARSGTRQPLRIGDFDHRIGEIFPIQGESGTHELTLVEASEIPNSPREGGGFRLEFHAAPEGTLPQRIYTFRLDDDLHEIFVVPMGPVPNGRFSYESVFF